MEKIPKIIHYCWFGKGPYPEIESKCMATWRILENAGYKLMLWNEDTFDIHMNKWVEKAYAERKYAFVADFVRLYALQTYGGVYLDTDVKIIKPFDDLLDKGGFLCFEDKAGAVIATCVIGMKKGHPILNDLLEYYNRPFDTDDIVTNFKSNAVMFTEKLQKYGLKLDGSRQKIANIDIYPRTYFCPMDYFSNWDKTEFTYCVHCFSGSWLPDDEYKKLASRRRLGWRIIKWIYVHLRSIPLVYYVREKLRKWGTL